MCRLGLIHSQNILPACPIGVIGGPVSRSVHSIANRRLRDFRNLDPPPQTLLLLQKDKQPCRAVEGKG